MDGNNLSVQDITNIVQQAVQSMAQGQQQTAAMSGTVMPMPQAQGAMGGSLPLTWSVPVEIQTPAGAATIYLHYPYQCFNQHQYIIQILMQQGFKIKAWTPNNNGFGGGGGGFGGFNRGGFNNYRRF
jgi:hypothetical protein